MVPTDPITHPISRQITRWKGHVAARFSQAVGSYDAAAPAQRLIAQALADRIRPLCPPTPKVLEIGCGTGFLTEALYPALAPRHWLATDVAAPMLDATAQRLNQPKTLETRLMDGEAPTVGGGWDLICSSLAVQWFLDLGAGLTRLYDLLAPGGLLAVTTLGAESFAPWSQACLAEGIAAYPHQYPAFATLRDRFAQAEVTEQLWPLGLAARGSGPTAFLTALRAIGADTPPLGQPPLPLGALKRALRRLPAGDGGDYHVLTLLWHKPATT